jgi:hypothetical protein
VSLIEKVTNYVKSLLTRDGITHYELQGEANAPCCKCTMLPHLEHGHGLCATLFNSWARSKVCALCTRACTAWLNCTHYISHELHLTLFIR